MTRAALIANLPDNTSGAVQVDRQFAETTGSTGYTSKVMSGFSSGFSLGFQSPTVLVVTATGLYVAGAVAEQVVI